jgi:hypothetical protein
MGEGADPLNPQEYDGAGRYLQSASVERHNPRPVHLCRSVYDIGGRVKTYIVCCGATGRAVIVGQSKTEPEDGKSITLTNARMVLYWDAACGGLLGLAAKGPKGQTRITSAVKKTGTGTVAQWVEVSPSAAKEIASWPAA